jgi:hypothetical protein
MANVDDMTQYEKRSLDILESINNKVTTLMNHIVAPVAPMAAAAPVAPMAAAAPVKKILSPEHLEKMRAARVSLRSKTVGELSVGELTSLLKAQEPEEWIRKIISGKTYLWNPANNHVYFSEADGSLGKWAGIYDPKSNKINTTVPESAKHEGGSRKQKATRKRSKRARKTRRS